MWNLKYDKNESIRNRLTNVAKRRVVVGGWGVTGVGGKDQEIGINKCKLLYIGWRSNKVLL